jgi:hypothetical protein
MIRRSNATLSRLLGAAVAAALLAGCGAAKTTAPAQSASPALSPSGTPAASAAPSAGPSDTPAPSDTPQPTLPLPHVDAALEDQLPSTIGGVVLTKFSQMLSAYIASPPPGGDKDLYAGWLVKFGKTPGDVRIAVAVDLTGQENFNARAIEVPGVKAANLVSSFTDAASKAGWLIASHPNWGGTGKDLKELIDPATNHAGYVYARDGVLFEIITDTDSLLLEALMAP